MRRDHDHRYPLSSILFFLLTFSDATSGSAIGVYNSGTTCDASSNAGVYKVANGNSVYFELENRGSVTYCIQTQAQQASGGCGTASGSATSSPACPSGTSTLTFSYATSPSNMCYTTQETTNGIRLTTSQQGWILSDLLSTTAVTTFYVTVESLSGDIGIGIAERADGSGCSTSNYPSTSWVGYASLTCKGDFLTFYTTRPSGATSAITSLMTAGHTYKFVVFPNAGPSATRCGEVDITGNASLLFLD